MYYLGIDIYKKSFTVPVLDEEGEAINNFLTYIQVCQQLTFRRF